MPRKSHSFRGIVLAVSAAGVAVSLGACTPPMPPDVMAAVAESQVTCQSGTVSVAVPDDLLGSMASVGAALSGVCPEQLVNEVMSTDPAPVRLVSGTPTPDQIAEFARTDCSVGSPIVVPAFSYPVTVAYNAPGLEGLYFTPEAVAGILNGTVTTFEDPLIADANEGFDLSGLAPFTVMSVDSYQGPVEAMTQWLAKEAPKAWTTGPSGTLTASTTYATTQELLDNVSMTESAVAILPGYQALTYGLAAAALPSTPLNDDGLAGEPVVVMSDDTQLAKVGAGAATVTLNESGTQMIASAAVGGVPSAENFDLAASKIVLAEGQPMVGWPVMAYAHVLVCDSPADPLPLSFAQYLVRLAGQGALETFGVTPLPEPIRIGTFKPLKVTVKADAPLQPSAQSPAGTAPATATP